MTISIWRYSHLALAVSSFVFIVLASLTGIILAFEPISNQVQPYRVDDFNKVTLAETIQHLKTNYIEILNVDVDVNDFVSASVITEEGDAETFYINPKTGTKIGDIIEKSPLFQWTTNFHRSLFLKSTGRIFIGITSFLLFLIAVSGTVLIVKRQRGFKRFFNTIVNENFAQYYHVVLGRLSLIPIIILTLTGVYLSLYRFDLLPKETLTQNVNYDEIVEAPKRDIKDQPIFRDTKLSEVRSVEFPFSDDVEDYYTLQLKDREVLVNQYTGDILSESKYPFIAIASRLSINLHTGQGSIIWSLILAIACLNILFFVYSGFAMTLKRRKAKLKNKFKKDNAKYIILIGSENGSTLQYANMLHKQLLKLGESSFIAELNSFSTYKNCEHLVVITATYGQGEAPENANKFFDTFKNTVSEHAYSFSVVGFGSLAYSDFCKYAFDVDELLQTDPNAVQLLMPFTIHNKSFEAYTQWINSWSKKVGLQIQLAGDDVLQNKKRKRTFTVVIKSIANENPDDTFTIAFKSKLGLSRFKSGDLLAIQPEANSIERLYSVGKVNDSIFLSVKRQELGLCSNYLNELNPNNVIKARLIKNKEFRLSKRTKHVLMIANGTGIAPFLGMINQNTSSQNMHLYWGGRQESSFDIYKSIIDESLETKRLQKLEIGYSQQDEKKVYVQHLLERDAEHVAHVLKQKGVIMICGSIAMQKDVLIVLESICERYLEYPLSVYKNKGQLKLDCY
ncbi:PepSY domain-containing protein [Formosa sp. PL04]|uniref:PepSY domain-containing protein n=1 Tax=Formosa sp. PL04 TaxID=3081755 RepID=UPI002981C9DC|nr:PepSY domain-containing protein [Formosa sp. PL04]MDW5289091.1 PepSY domain-containing protein [Formosa sp. PL04]